MKIKIIAIGFLKEKFYKDAISEFKKRLSRYADLEILEIKEEKDSNPHSKEIEGKNILSHIKERCYVVALTLNKKEYTSLELASWLSTTLIKARGELVFVIGGSRGLSQDVLTRANDFLCLSKLTFTHQMSRVILLEQLYRCYKINNNEEYHK